ncbi:MAG: 5-formyltetrahydrofolate cyclo-ligase [Nocardioides sp.]
MNEGQSPHSLDPSGAVEAAKVALRDQRLAARKHRGLAAVSEAAQQICDHLMGATEVRQAATVAVYVSVGSEPGTARLLDQLSRAGKRVIAPVLMADNDLDWVSYQGTLHRAGRGLLEPDGPRLGVDAIAGADVVLVPALAVSDAGMRMGRGGGSYDRALARVQAGTFVCALAYADEVGPTVPAEPHDRRVDAVATEAGIVRFAGTF